MWIAPPVRFLKINVYAAVRESFVALACICHDDLGSTFWARSEIFPKMSPFKVETLALRMSAGEVFSRGLQKVIFESDSLTAISGVNDPSTLFDEEANSWFEAVRDMASEYPLWSFVKVSRQAFADSLAKWAADRKFVGCIPLAFLPVCLLKQSAAFDPP